MRRGAARAAGQRPAAAPAALRAAGAGPSVQLGRAPPPAAKIRLLPGITALPKKAANRLNIHCLQL